MLVYELIEKLKECDQEYEIKMDTPYEDVVNELEIDDDEKAIYLLSV